MKAVFKYSRLIVIGLGATFLQGCPSSPSTTPQGPGSGQLPQVYATPGVGTQSKTTSTLSIAVYSGAPTVANQIFPGTSGTTNAQAINMTQGSCYTVVVSGTNTPSDATFSVNVQPISSASLQTITFSNTLSVGTYSVSSNSTANTYTIAPGQGSCSSSSSGAVTKSFGPGKYVFTFALSTASTSTTFSSPSYVMNLNCPSGIITASSSIQATVSLSAVDNYNIFNYTVGNVKGDNTGAIRSGYPFNPNTTPYYNCAIDPTGTGIIYSGSQSCDTAFNNIYTNYVGTSRNIYVVVSDRCNSALGVSVASVPIPGPSLVSVNVPSSAPANTVGYNAPYVMPNATQEWIYFELGSSSSNDPRVTNMHYLGQISKSAGTTPLSGKNTSVTGSYTASSTSSNTDGAFNMVVSQSYVDPTAGIVTGGSVKATINVSGLTDNTNDLNQVIPLTSSLPLPTIDASAAVVSSVIFTPDTYINQGTSTFASTISASGSNSTPATKCTTLWIAARVKQGSPSRCFTKNDGSADTPVASGATPPTGTVYQTASGKTHNAYNISYEVYGEYSCTLGYSETNGNYTVPLSNGSFDGQASLQEVCSGGGDVDGVSLSNSGS